MTKTEHTLALMVSRLCKREKCNTCRVFDICNKYFGKYAPEGKTTIWIVDKIQEVDDGLRM